MHGERASARAAAASERSLSGQYEPCGGGAAHTGMVMTTGVAPRGGTTPAAYPGPGDARGVRCSAARIRTWTIGTKIRGAAVTPRRTGLHPVTQRERRLRRTTAGYAVERAVNRAIRLLFPWRGLCGRVLIT